MKVMGVCVINELCHKVTYREKTSHRQVGVQGKIGRLLFIVSNDNARNKGKMGKTTLHSGAALQKRKKKKVPLFLTTTQIYIA